MKGRDFTLFLGSMYREWIYDHIGDQFSDEYDVVPFSRDMTKWNCSIDIHTGTVKADPMPVRMQELLGRFGYCLSDVTDWLESCLQQEKYVSREYGDESW